MKMEERMNEVGPSGKFGSLSSLALRRRPGKCFGELVRDKGESARQCVEGIYTCIMYVRFFPLDAVLCVVPFIFLSFMKFWKSTNARLGCLSHWLAPGYRSYLLDSSCFWS